MTKKEKMFFACDCGMDFEIEFYHEIDGANDKKSKELLISGELFHQVCPYCGRSYYDKYPVNYRDDENKLVIASGNEGDIAYLQDDYNRRNHNGENQGYLYAAATSYTELRNIIIATENCMDYRIVTIMLALKLAERKMTNNEDKKYKRIKNIYLDYNSTHELGSIIECVTYDDEIVLEKCEFRINLYKYSLEKYSRLLDGASELYFGLLTANYLLHLDEDSIEGEKGKIGQFAIVTDNSGKSELVIIRDFQIGKVKVDDTVIIVKKGSFIKGVVERLIERSFYSLPKSPELMGILGWICNDINFNPIPYEEEFDNTKLREELIEYKNRKYKNLPTNLLYESNLYIAQNISEDKISDKQSLLICKYNGKKYFCAYFNKDDMPKNTNFDLVAVPCRFDSIMEYALSMADQLDGIAVNPDNESILLKTSALLDYKADRVMTNHDRMHSYLCNITDEDKNYITEECFNMIYEVYHNGKTPRMLAEEYKMEVEEVGNLLGYGYSRMIQILSSK